jgi:hypothetical protein
MGYIKILKIAFTRGYVLIAISALCFVLTMGIWLLYGEPKTITTDPNYTLGTEGVTHYMTEEQFERYDFWCRLLSKIGFISGLTGAILCLWAYRTTNTHKNPKSETKADERKPKPKAI